MPLLGCAAAHIEAIAPDELDRRLHRAAHDHAPAVVFGAVWRDRTTVQRAAGLTDLQTSRAASTSTPFAWFSITKLFTATAVLQLVESGRIDLDQPVSRYLKIQLLLNGRDGPGLDAMTQRLVGAAPKLDYEPGSRSSYSNLGYLLLGQLIERVSGERYEQYVELHVLQPLGCDATVFGVPPDGATGYQRKWSFMGVAARWMLDRRFFGDPIDGYWPLRPFTVDGAPYGEPFAYHPGGGGGFRSELRVYPRLGYAVAVLANETSFPAEQFTRLVIRERTREGRR